MPEGDSVKPRLPLRRRHHDGLLQAELQKGLARHFYLLATREHLDARARGGACARTNRRALAAACNRADDGSSYRAAAHFLGRVRTAALSFQAVVAADDRIVLPIDYQACQFELQL